MFRPGCYDLSASLEGGQTKTTMWTLTREDEWGGRQICSHPWNMWNRNVKNPLLTSSSQTSNCQTCLSHWGTAALLMFILYKYNYIQCRYARAELFYDNFNVWNTSFSRIATPKQKKIVRVTSLYQKQKLFCSTLSVLTTKRAFFFFTKRVIHCEETRTKDSRL